MKLTIIEIQEILLHRYPFLLLDSVEEITPGEYAVAKKNVTVNEQVFQGHFPGNPVLPGVLIIESLAQADAVALLSMPELKEKTACFDGLDKARFRQKVIPGDTLILEVELLKVHASAGMGKGVAKVNGKRVAEAELTFMIG